MKLARQISGFLAFSLLGGTALAQRPIFILPAVQTPLAVSPAPSFISNYAYNTMTQAFVWDQYPAIADPSVALPNHFLLCFREINGPACSHATAQFNLPAATTSRALIRNNFNQAPSGYRYTYKPVMPEAGLEHTVEWLVGACANNADSSCKFTNPRNVLLMTRDIQAVSVGVDDGGSLIGFEGSVRNLGTRDSLSSTARIEYWDVFTNPVTEMCITNVNDPMFALRPDLFAIDDKGTTFAFATLMRNPAGALIAPPNVVAITQANSTMQWNQTQVFEPVLPPMAGVAAPVPKVTVGYLEIGAPNNTRPRGFAVKISADWTNAMLEFDQNNRVAGCVYLRRL